MHPYDRFFFFTPSYLLRISPMKQNSYTIKLTDEQQNKLIALLKHPKYIPAEVPHTQIAVSTENCRINLYNSGKCLVQGKGAEEWITFTLEPDVTGEALLGYEAVHDPESVQPHMGIDESGKGDLFGPLVISAVYTDAKTVEILKEIGAKDSKRISSDRVALQLASAIRKQLDGKYTLVTLGPEAYNRMYASMKNGKKIKMDQRTKAESDPAVAAASILARAGFLNGLRKIEKEHGIETVPKGCSAKVKQIATELVAHQGPGILAKTCKLHFKTTEEVLAANGYTRANL